MPHFVYLLLSKTLDRHYIGSTAKAHDWVIVFSEKFNSKPEALAREKKEIPGVPTNPVVKGFTKCAATLFKPISR